jgi:DNA-binding winged helix-turn-helix (wHTH) protein/tetratricopeptide (TPR) repeat protein
MVMAPRMLQFAGFTLDLHRLCLLAPSGPAELRPKSFEVLRYLVEHAGRVATKEEIMNAVWPNTTVTEESLTRCISDARRALGDGQQKIIKTVPRRGYMVDVPISSNPLAAARITTAQMNAADMHTSQENGTPAKTGDSIDRIIQAGERKQVTVLCANCKSTLETTAERDPEDALAVFEAVLGLITEAIDRYEGTINLTTANGVVALFGVPRAQEDHAVRACHAAVRIQEAVTRYAATRPSTAAAVSVHIGLNSGQVVTRPISGRSPPEYRAMGQTSQLAADLEQLAPPGATLVSSETLRLAEGHVNAKPFNRRAPARALRGPVYQLVEVVMGQSRFRALAARGLTDFTGRDTEMAQIERLHARAQQGNGQVVAIIGEPGMGKSRLLHEFLRTGQHPHSLTLETASVSYRKTTSYVPVIALLKAYFKIAERDAPGAIRDKVTGAVLALDPALAPDLPPLLALLDAPVEQSSWALLDSTQRRQHTLQALKRLILRESVRQPVILAFEDLHWVDGASQDFLEALIDGLTHAPVLLLLTYRPEYKHPWGSKSYYTQLHLNAFQGDANEAFLHNLIGDDASLKQLKALLAVYANPFFLEESVRSLVETNVIAGGLGNYRVVGPLQEVRIPATVQAILAARIDRLSASSKQLLQAASVLGTQVPRAILRLLAGSTEDELDRGLAELREGEFLFESRLFPDVEYAFKHALTHEVAYGCLLGEPRRTLHQRCVEAIERLHSDRLAEHAEQLAHHAVRGELRQKAVVYLRQAGRKAATRSVPHDARSWLEQALAILETLPQSGLALEQAFDVRLELRPVLNQLGEPRRMLERLHEAEILAERLNDDRQRGRVCAFMATTHSLLGELDEAIATGNRARHIAEGLGDLELRILATSFLGQAHYYRGEYEAVVKAATDNLAALPAEWTYEYFGNVAPASVFDRAWLAMALAQLGRFSEASQLEAEAIRLAEPMQHAFTLGRAYLAAGTLHPLEGNWSKARPLIERWIEVARTGNVALHLPWAVASSAWILSELGQTNEALVRLREGENLVDRQATRGIVGQSAWAYHALGRAALLLGRFDDARRLSKQAIDFSAAQPGFRAHAFHLAGDIVLNENRRDLERSEGHYGRALALAEARGMLPLVAHCHMGLARYYRRMAERTRSSGHFTKAMGLYRDLGAQHWLCQARAESRTP